ncbi:MAG: hypothetical protein Q9160_006778 [Pyrenula sp. 1 TL-2023]
MLLAFNVASTAREKVFSEGRKMDPSLRRLVGSAMTFDAVKDVLIDFNEDAVEDPYDDLYRDPFDGPYRDPFDDPYQPAQRSGDIKQDRGRPNNVSPMKRTKTATAMGANKKVSGEGTTDRGHLDKPVTDQAAWSASETNGKNRPLGPLDIETGMYDNRTSVKSRYWQRASLRHPCLDSVTDSNQGLPHDNTQYEHHNGLPSEDDEDGLHVELAITTTHNRDITTNRGASLQTQSPRKSGSSRNLKQSTSKRNSPVTDTTIPFTAIDQSPPIPPTASQQGMDTEPGPTAIISSDNKNNNINEPCATDLLERCLEARPSKQSERCPPERARGWRSMLAPLGTPLTNIFRLY